MQLLINRRPMNMRWVYGEGKTWIVSHLGWGNKNKKYNRNNYELIAVIVFTAIATNDMFSAMNFNMIVMFNNYLITKV